MPKGDFTKTKEFIIPLRGVVRDGQLAALLDQSGQEIGMPVTAVESVTGGIEFTQGVVTWKSVKTYEEVLEAVEAARSAHVVMPVSGRVVFPDAAVSLNGVVGLTIVANGEAVFDRDVTTAARPYFSTASGESFGKVRCEGAVEFRGHWNRSSGYRANFGSNLCRAGAAFKLYGQPGDSLIIRGAKFNALKDLPVVVYGAAEMRVYDCESYRCRDIGAVDVDFVDVSNNRIFYSEDNGVSASRRCRNVRVDDNLIVGANSGVWVSGYDAGQGYQLAPRQMRISGNKMICCMTGVHADGAPQDAIIEGNIFLWTGFITTDDNAAGEGNGTLLDTTISTDTAAGASLLPLADAALLNPAGGWLFVHQGPETNPRVYQYSAVSGSSAVLVEPTDEVYYAAFGLRVTGVETPTSGVTGYPIYVVGESALRARRVRITNNSVHGWGGKAAIYADKVEAGGITGNNVGNPMGTVTADGIVRGVMVTDGGSSTNKVRRFLANHNVISMAGPAMQRKRGVEYSTSATIKRGLPIVSDSNYIDGVLIGNEVYMPTPLHAPSPTKFFDKFGVSRESAESETVKAEAGSLLLLDFARASTLDVGSSIANAQALTDIGGATSSASVVLTGAATAKHDTDTLGLVLRAANADAAYIDCGTDFGMNGTTNRQFLAILWFRMLELHTVSGDEGVALLSLSAGSGNRALQFRVYDNGSALALSFWWDNRGMSPQPTALNGDKRLTTHQFALSYQQSGGNGIANVYIDGALVAGPHSVADAAFSTTGSTLRVGAGAAVGKTVSMDTIIHRLLIEDLVASGRDPLTVVQADYTANVGRYEI